MVTVGSSRWRAFWGSRHSTYEQMSPHPALAERKVSPDSSEQLVDGLDQPWDIDLNRIP